MLFHLWTPDISLKFQLFFSDHSHVNSPSFFEVWCQLISHLLFDPFQYLCFGGWLQPDYLIYIYFLLITFLGFRSSSFVLSDKLHTFSKVSSSDTWMLKTKLWFPILSYILFSFISNLFCVGFGHINWLGRLFRKKWEC